MSDPMAEERAEYEEFKAKAKEDFDRRTVETVLTYTGNVEILSAHLANDWYLSQGFMEAPDWTDLSEDFRNGFRGTVKHFIAPLVEHFRAAERAAHAAGVAEGEQRAYERASMIDWTQVLADAARETGAIKRLSMHDLRKMHQAIGRALARGREGGE